MSVIRTGQDVAIVYMSRGYEQLGILHRPAAANGLGVIFVPAGHQYRIGPYRQHVLMAREFGSRGITSLRIDPPAIGDSDGNFLDFDLDIELRAAVDVMQQHCPDLKQVVLWGICGSASVVAMHAPRDLPVTGMILVNPWLRSEESLAKTYLKRYYLKKLFELSFWGKLLSGRLDLTESLKSFFTIARAARGASNNVHEVDDHAAVSGRPADDIGLGERMANGLEGFSGRVLIVLSDDDLTAQEFVETATASPRWRKILASPHVVQLNVPLADHVFSEPQQRAQFFAGTLNWLEGFQTAPPDRG